MLPLRHLRPSQLLSLACGVIVAFAVSCSEAPRDGARRADVQEATGIPPLEALASIPAVIGERRELRLEPVEGVTAWRVEGCVPKWLRAPNDAQGASATLLLPGSKTRTVVVPGPFSIEELNQVQIELQIQTRTRVRVHLLVDGTPRLGRAPRVIASNAKQTITAYFPEAQGLTEEISGISITLPGGCGGVGLHSVTLLSEPLRRWFPEPGAAPTRMSVESDTRNAVVVTSEVPVGGEFFTTGAHELRFSYALPESLRIEGVNSQLELTLGRAGQPQHTTRLELSSADTGWRSTRIPLLAVAGEELTAIEWRVSLSGAEQDFGAALLAEQRIVLPQENPETVVLITSDTHRGDHLGVAGEGVQVSTPNLDRLAARGVMFEQAFATSNITMPSHIALLTGAHPRDTGIVDNATFLSPAADTLAEAYLAAGYRTFAAVSAAHLGDPRGGMGQGFERHSGPPGVERTAQQAVDQLEAWLAESTDEPLFIWLHVFDAHGPYQAPAGYANSEPLEGVEDTDAHARQVRAYGGEISYLDAQLGRLLDTPRFENAILAVTSDHGEVLGNHAIWFVHERLYTDTIRVPLILTWPGGPRGERVAARVQNNSIARTLLDLSGLSAVEFPGENLLAEGVANDTKPRFAISTQGESASITRGKWHLILNLKRHQAGNQERQDTWRERHQVELYDLDRDPGCSLDRHRNYQKEAQLLRRQLVVWLLQATDLGWAQARTLDAETFSQLQGLGYTGVATDTSSGWFDRDCDCGWCERYR